jgi:hypothetical protein
MKDNINSDTPKKLLINYKIKSTVIPFFLYGSLVL